MPGVLMKRSHDQIEEASRNTVDANLGAEVGNGLKRRRSTDLTNGVRGNGVLPSVTNGDLPNGVGSDLPSAVVHIPSAPIVSTAVKGAVGAEPPTITHITQGYVPLSRLITRLAQDTFNEFDLVLNQLADIEDSTSDGDSPATRAQRNVEKKVKLFEFAQQRRAKLIKALVLCDWSRNAEDVSTCVDLNIWINEQKAFFRDAYRWIASLNNFSADLKRLAPQIRLALEVMSTGRADWIPNFTYATPDALSTRQILDALRHINTLLTIRLTTHEDVPHALRKWSVKHGRVKFTVLNDFELDLSLAKEDSASQLYFLDFRWAFDPCRGSLPDGPLRNEVEYKVNDILGREGLQGCYDFLHEITLTHKLTILRHQTYELARAFWSDNIKVENVRRGFVLQYWLNRPGPKSWIEFGIRSGKREDSEPFSQQPMGSFIKIRWHRQGQEVLDEQVSFDDADLSMEQILNQVITCEIYLLFRQSKRKLRNPGSVYRRKRLLVKHRAAERDPDECALSLQMTSSRAVTVQIEPVTGSFSLRPYTQLHAKAERELNGLSDPSGDAASRLANLKCLSSLEEIGQQVRQRDWRRLQTIRVSKDAIDRYFGKEVGRIAFFRLPRWEKIWTLAATAGLGGNGWWIIELRDLALEFSQAELAAGADRTIRRAFPIPLGQKSANISPTSEVLETVESTGAAIVAQYVDSRGFIANNTSCGQKPTSVRESLLRVPGLSFRLPRMKPPITSDGNVQWCHSQFDCVFSGYVPERAEVVRQFTGRLRSRGPKPGEFASSMDSSLAFHPSNGAFSFRISAPMSQSIFSSAITHLHRIRSLIGFLETIRSASLRCDKISLHELVFTYTSPPEGSGLRARISFADNSPNEIHFDRGNPHLRIKDHLSSLLLDRQDLSHIVLILRATTPLLRALEDLESRPRIVGSVSIFPRSALVFSVRYKNPRFAYDIRLRQRSVNDEFIWFTLTVPDGSTVFDTARDATHGLKAERASVDQRSEKMKQEWQWLRRGRSQGWFGMSGGIGARVDGIADLLMVIDGIWTRINEGASDGGEETDPGKVSQAADAKETEQENGAGKPKEVKQTGETKERQQRGKEGSKVVVEID